MQSIAAWPCVSRSGFASRSLITPAAAPAATMRAPTLILIREADDWIRAERCREMVAHPRPDGAPIALTFNREPRRRAVATRYQLPQPLARMQSAGGQRRGKKRCTPSPPLIWAGHPPRADRQVRKARLCSKVSCRALGPDTVHGEIPVVDDVEIRRTSSTMAHHSRLK
jgi:hypothetical protein